MYNFAQQTQPQTWDEYFGQEQAKQQAITFITEGVAASPRCLLITGQSGTGKSTLIRLLIKSMQCLQRPTGSLNPCGQCAACKRDLRSNTDHSGGVIWVQPGLQTSETIDAQVKAALTKAERGHTLSSNPDQDILWLVFDEWQGIPMHLRRQLLVRAEMEVKNNNVCYVFLTMQFGRLPQEEQIAFQWRALHIKLQPYSHSKIAEFLQVRFNVVPPVAQLIAQNAMYSIGMAKALYDQIRRVDPDCSWDAAVWQLQFARDQDRWCLWDILARRGSVKELLELLDTIYSYADPRRFVQQLQDDIMHSTAAHGMTEERRFAMSMLLSYNHQLQTSYLGHFLIPLIGLDLVTKEVVFRNSNTPLGYAV